MDPFYHAQPPEKNPGDMDNGEMLTLDWLATPIGDEWHDRLVPFYRSLRDFHHDLTVPAHADRISCWQEYGRGTTMGGTDGKTDGSVP